MANSPVEDAERVKRPHSIDLSLELEHQLALEEGDGGTPAHDAAGARSSLDPHVLASIVGQLRDQIARITTERDDLLNLMSAAVAREADLKDALQDMTDKFTAAREEVASARELHASDQENIALLRNKVEESRFVTPYSYLL
jgi:chromosome segregation ATPase